MRNTRMAGHVSKKLLAQHSYKAVFELRSKFGLLEKIGRGERIRTSDPLVPNQVLYQAEPRPVIA